MPCELAKSVLAGSRSDLAKAITLVESQLPKHRLEAEQLLADVMPHTGHGIRLAISGAPGVGKSTFIESFGLSLVDIGKKVAVLAIDPSSPLSGGSILGDKTRMEQLARSPLCFIRPSPSQGALGGVARHTREGILLCEAAGYDVVVVETVGIGQSEALAASMVDMFIQLHQPFSGDELQGIKKGVLELADLVVVTKADGDMKAAAEVAVQELSYAVTLSQTASKMSPAVVSCSAKTNEGISHVWELICLFISCQKKSAHFEKKRATQKIDWLHQEIDLELQHYFRSRPTYQHVLAASEEDATKQTSRSCTALARIAVTRILK